MTDATEGIAPGECRILNVGAGDLSVSFDKNNVSETIRARRVIKDMIRRGFALLIEVERDGEKRWERAQDFDEATDRYIIADFDPELAAVQDAQQAKPRVDLTEEYQASMAALNDRRTSTRMAIQQAKESEEGTDTDEQGGERAEPAADTGEKEGPEGGAEQAAPQRRNKRGRPPGKRLSGVSAHATRAVAVGRSAGG